MTQQTQRADFESLLNEHFRAGYQCLLIPTCEESRAEAAIGRVAKHLQMGVITWDHVDGFSCEAAQETKWRHPTEALRAVAAVGKDAIFHNNHVFIFRDLDDFFGEPSVRRALRTLTEGNKLVNKRWKRPILILSPRREIHPKLRSAMQILEFSLPGPEAMGRVFDFVKTSVESDDPSKAQCDDTLRERLINSLLGLSATEAENALSRCLVRHGGFCDAMTQTILDEKAAIIKKSEVLTYIPEQSMATRDMIGGYDRLMEFIDRRSLAYQKEARALGLDYPKGVVLLGVPGTGKSYVAKAIARLLGLPGYVMDVGSVFGSLVGESESRMRDALRTVEAQQGCVLLLDEADKAFGGAVDSSGDSGVTRRVFGQMLTWLAEKNDRTFVIMTLNRTKGIPPEFLRAGRFDKVFFTDLPNAVEREAIFKIHMKKRLVDPEELNFSREDWATLVEDKLEQMVGSEIEQVVVEAKLRAFETRRHRVPSFEDVIAAAAEIVPLATLDAEGVNEIREFCRNRATPVSSPLTTGTRRRRDNRHSRSVDLAN